MSQAALSLALHVKVPPPVLLILRVWTVGLLPPCWAVKERLVGLAPMAGGTGAFVTVNVTGTVTEEAPGALTVTVPLWLPAVKEPVLALNVTAPFPVPEAGLNDNHAALSLAIQLSVPPPVLAILKVWVAGLAPPCVAVKVKLVGLAPMVGGTGAVVTVNVTGTVSEEAPEALRVTVPL